jgi:hypothetical protein
MSNGASSPGRDSIDREHLMLVEVFHYVVGGLHILFASFLLIHVVLGVGLVIAPLVTSVPEGVPPAAAGILMAGFAFVGLLLGWGFGAATIFSCYSIRQRRRRTFSFFVAAINCALFPFGTLLGVFTIIVLSRESVKQLYTAAGHAPPALADHQR